MMKKITTMLAVALAAAMLLSVMQTVKIIPYAQGQSAVGGGAACAHIPPRAPLPPICGRLIIVKNVQGGTANASQFTMNVTGINTSQSTFQGNSSGTNVTLSPGLYNVTEIGRASDYTPSYSSNCSGNIAGGQIRTCVVTNTFTPPYTLTVIKNVTNDDGGTARASDFTFNVILRHCDNSSAGTGQINASERGVTLHFNSCGYEVGELVPVGYTLTTDLTQPNCTRSTVSPGANYTCTITNDDIPRPTTVIVTKVVNGGSSSPEQFTICLRTYDPSTGVTTPSTPSCAPGSGSGFAYTVRPGVIMYSEPNSPRPHRIQFTCDHNPLTGGQTARCTLTNIYTGP